MTVETSITIWQDLAGNKEWRGDLEDIGQGRALHSPAFATREAATDWAAKQVGVPLPPPPKWVRSTVEGLREEFWCLIDAQWSDQERP